VNNGSKERVKYGTGKRGMISSAARELDRYVSEAEALPKNKRQGLNVLAEAARERLRELDH
jgi:hypothetical protein